MTYGFGQVSFKEANTDAFGRLRISTLVNQFESKFTYGVEDSFKTVSAAGGTATFLPNEAAYNLAVTTAAGSKVTRESYRYLQYHPGRSQLIMMTGVLGLPVENCTKRIGYFDNNDGLFFAQLGTSGLAVVRRTSTSGSPVDNIVTQSNWNIDKMNGTGPSGITFDPTKTHIFVIDFQWLGVGAVRFGLVIDGELHYVHQMNHANILTTVYMKSAWLPLRYELVNTGATATTASLKQICSHVASESGMEERGAVRAAASNSLTNISSANWTPIIGIKISPTLNGYPFRGSARMIGVEAVVTGNNPVMFMVHEFPTTITGANWVSVAPDSPALIDTSATVVSGGVNRLAFAGSSGKAGTGTTAPEDIQGVAGSTAYLLGRAIGGNSTAFGAINWREII